MWRLKKILVFDRLQLQPEIVPATKYPVFASLLLGAGFLATLPQSNVCRAAGSIGLVKVTADNSLANSMTRNYFVSSKASREKAD